MLKSSGLGTSHADAGALGWDVGLTERLVPTGLGRLAVRVGGKADGPVIVCWPSLLMTGAMWRHQVAHYEPTHRLVLLDPPGIGQSDPLRRTITFEECSDALVSVLDELGVERCILLGCSWGALLGSVFAAWHPERLAAAVLSNGTAGAPTTAERVKMTMLITAIGLNRTAPRWLASATKGAFAGRTALAEKPAFVDALDAVLDEDPKSIAIAMRSILLGRCDRRALLGGIKGVPTLVIAGEEDGQFTVPVVRKFADAIPGSRFVLVPRTGHLAPFESPGPVNAAIDAFLADLAAPVASPVRP